MRFSKVIIPKKEAEMTPWGISQNSSPLFKVDENELNQTLLYRSNNVIIK
jgi:hypothetical protein